jgi:prolyl 4-hydroxylase
MRDQDCAPRHGRALGSEHVDGKDLQELAGGLLLDGRPLEPPRLLLRGEEDAFAVAPPSFVRHKDPLRQQKQVRLEEVALPSGASLADDDDLGVSFARIIHNVLEPSECAEMLSEANKYGFAPLGNRFRCMLDCPELAAYLLEVMRPHLPLNLCHGRESLDEMNSRLRFTCYLPGQEFTTHVDTFYTQPSRHSKEGNVSRATVLLYLNDVPEVNGGGTAFVGKHRISCQPRGGSVLVFTQDLLHEGLRLNAGLKYFVRTELMFRRYSGGQTQCLSDDY